MACESLLRDTRGFTHFVFITKFLKVSIVSRLGTNNGWNH